MEVRSYFPFPYAAGPFRPSAGGGGGGVSLGTHQADQPPAPEVVAAQQQLPHFPYAPRGGGSASASLSVECAICLGAAPARRAVQRVAGVPPRVPPGLRRAVDQEQEHVPAVQGADLAVVLGIDRSAAAAAR